MKKLMAATASVALCTMSVAPAAAETSTLEAMQYQGFQAPRGATATANFRVPLGDGSEEGKATYGLTFSMGKTMGSPTMGEQPITREMRLADVRFSGDKLVKAQVTSVDFANLEKDERLGLTGPDATLWTVAGLVAVGVLACFVIWECFDDDDDDLEDEFD
ncbi:MAG: hypothetical protein ACFBQW_09275 [Sphingomonadaceae bacterium]